MLALIALAELLGMAVWFAATAVAPELREQWGLTPAQSGWLTSVVQLGFVAGTLGAAALNVADLFPSRAYFATCAVLAAGANGALLFAGGYGPALVLRFLTGFFLAGVYPPAMKMASTWFRSGRGLAIGTVVGALTVGKALPYLIDALGGVRMAPVVLGTSAAALAAAALVAVGYRDGPFAFPRRPFSWRLAGEVARRRDLRLVTAGYLGHMWELYCFWAWIAAFLAASASARAAAGQPAPGAESIALLAFLIIACGGIACVLGGQIADRVGRERLVMGALAVSGGCALVVGFAFAKSFWLLVPIAAVWGMAVIADSAQFSALVTELAPSHAVGTALTLQTSLGFLLTTVTIQMVPHLVEWVGWQWAFPALALGPLAGIAAIGRLARLRRLQGVPTPG
jgi:MFS family permease